MGSAHRVLHLARDAEYTPVNVADGGSLYADRSPCMFVLDCTGDETRVLLPPDKAGLQATVVLRTGTSCTISSTTSLSDETEQTSIVLSEIGQFARLQAMPVTSGFEWRIMEQGGGTGAITVPITPASQQIFLGESTASRFYRANGAGATPTPGTVFGGTSSFEVDTTTRRQKRSRQINLNDYCIIDTNTAAARAHNQTELEAIFAGLPEGGAGVYGHGYIFFNGGLVNPGTGESFTLRGDGSLTLVSVDPDLPTLEFVENGNLTDEKMMAPVTFRDFNLVGRGPVLKITDASIQFLLENVHVCASGTVDEGEFDLTKYAVEFLTCYGTRINNLIVFENAMNGIRFRQCNDVSVGFMSARNNGGIGIRIHECANISGQMNSEANYSWNFDFEDFRKFHLTSTYHEGRGYTPYLGNPSPANPFQSRMTFCEGVVNHHGGPRTWSRDAHSRAFVEFSGYDKSFDAVISDYYGNLTSGDGAEVSPSPSTYWVDNTGPTIVQDDDQTATIEFDATHSYEYETGQQGNCYVNLSSYLSSGGPTVQIGDSVEVEVKVTLNTAAHAWFLANGEIAVRGYLDGAFEAGTLDVTGNNVNDFGFVDTVNRPLVLRMWGKKKTDAHTIRVRLFFAWQMAKADLIGMPEESHTFTAQITKVKVYS